MTEIAKVFEKLERPSPLFDWLSIERPQRQGGGIVAGLTDQTVAGDDAQVVGPGPLHRADQLGVDHLAIQLLLGHRVEVAEGPDLPGFAQA